ncbi:putative sugar ABC transporter permease protein [Actinoplanes missouriensis 431]|uniref:Putative sugar ABC transporter permease protein n=1 Tax=Actinoplanes missouriensis (strain ATCC 14538 / DSM 43046 / CBS 188.64 / JCM 3121 / NBRC 102363 / NCIMB 12654 / NRRL B-3342 / UNCC 431) TaxID=512565 RepID=I0HI66_ACTM4|nr:ABC transporter permease [Actinoplanes missouriensis]BAL92703.1 putative sugar ABC transporter permease protein [Actinoplanes missouriensis 431]
MSTATVEASTELAAPEPFWTRPRRLGAGLVLIGILAAALFGSLAKSETARFTLSEDAEGAALSINGQLGAVLFGIVTIVAGGLLFASFAKRFQNLLLSLGILAFVLSFLCWQVAGKFLPLVDTTSGTLQLALPLILGALAGVLGERSGVVNVAIEGQFLMGAFAGALVGTMATSVWAGLISAAVGGVIIAAILAVLSIRYLVDQTVVGIVLNLFALGVTGFLYEGLMQRDASTYNEPPQLPSWRIPGLADIPVIGPVLFDTNLLVWVALVLVVVIHFGLTRTRWGLRTRAVGEHPTAADTVGVRVRGLRYTNVLLGGVVAGLGGAYFTLVATGSFTKNMTAGAGFIALAALIFGRFTPFGALGAALFFGFAQKLATYLSAVGSPVPSQFLNMLPYLATIIAVAGLVGRVRAPAADGVPYIKN